MTAMAHPVALARYGDSAQAWVLDLPGCVVGGSMDEISALLPVSIAEHCAWLRQHGEQVEPSVAWTVVETLDGLGFAATGGEFCFTAEQAPLSSAELERGIARMQFARADLLAAVAPLPDAVLDWAPPDSSVAAFDTWAPEMRTIREVVRHVLQLEVYYRDGLRDGPAAGIFEMVDDPATERARTLDRLLALTAADRSRIWHPIRPSRTAPEAWSVRKLLRRIIAHERAHAAEIAQRRTWLLLGVPRLRPA